MCRLFASRSAAPLRVDRLLLDSKASLCALSHEHRHGWGIAHYRGGEPALRRGTAPAYEDPEFAKAARAVESDCVLAHIRRRSVGEFSVEDNHPFERGRFFFAHNGTVQRFDELQPELEALIAPDLRATLRGSTDSERCFLLALTRLQQRGRMENSRLEDLADALAFSVHSVARLAPGADKGHLLTFLMTDGRHLAGVRFGEKELWISTESATGAAEPRRVFLASEPLSEDDRWTPIDDRGLVGVGPDLAVRQFALDDFNPARAA